MALKCYNIKNHLGVVIDVIDASSVEIALLRYYIEHNIPHAKRRELKYTAEVVDKDEILERASCSQSEKFLAN
jgi:hypothetical protein